MARLRYPKAEERANELRIHAVDAAERMTDSKNTPEQLLRDGLEAIVAAILEVGARLELLELELELGRADGEED
jgi:hypothetical protein